MNQETDHSALKPQELRRHPHIVGSPVQFQDGSIFMVPAMPVGMVGDPLEKAIEVLSEKEIEVQGLTAEQERAVQKKLAEIDPAANEDTNTADVLKVHREFDALIRPLTRELFDLQLRVVFLALRLNYDIEEEQLAGITTLRQVRQVSMILSGAPQADEMEEAIRIIRRARPNDE